MLAVDASVWLPSAALVLGAIITAIGQFATRRGLRDVSGAVQEVHAEVKTGNHKTIGGLQALAEGRRIREDIEPGDRTHDEQGYVRAVEDDEQKA
jgi:hypothetical protein